uniref:Uncharacterized protein n=1 Tax=Ditylenchus dipsaci TaxID=166011 RepID=A0A915EFE5_9BILA
MDKSSSPNEELLIDKIKQHAYYFLREDKVFERRCVNVIALKAAVTCAHSLDGYLKPKIDEQEGSKFTVYSVLKNEDGSSEKESQTRTVRDALGSLIQCEKDEVEKLVFQHGSIINTSLDHYDQMCTSVIGWSCDSGGGLYSETGGLLGIFSSSLTAVKDGENRVMFVPSTIFAKLYLCSPNLKRRATPVENRFGKH